MYIKSIIAQWEKSKQDLKKPVDPEKIKNFLPESKKQEIEINTANAIKAILSTL